MWNPLRTLAGRLVLVTIVAIVISYAVVFAMFANERGSTLRRLAQNAVAERIAYHATQLRQAPAAERRRLVALIRDYGIRYRVTDAPPLAATEGADAQRLSRLVSEALNGAEVFARTRTVSVDEPQRWRRRLARGDRAAFDPPPPSDVFIMAPEDQGGGARSEMRVRLNPDDNPRRFRAAELTLVIALGPNSWLEARTRLPAPRPMPMSFFWAALASMLAVGAGAVLVSRQIGRPLADLARAAQRLGVGETNVAVAARGPDDVRRASDAFNAMAERLGRQMSRQRQMLWALSHDLRTPITALRLRAELVEDDTLKQKLLSPLAEMEILTEQALALARAGASEETREDVDLAEIARTLCGELAELGVLIEADAPNPMQVRCRPNEIARAMRNLAENASKYGGGGIMRVHQADGAAIIEVLDEGPGLSESDRAHVLEPFYRADPARSGGAGLGLSIVQAIADGHGGRLSLENRTPKGLIARLSLPAQV